MRENLPAMLADRAREFGDHPAMRFRSSDLWRDISYTAMDRSVQAVARGLLDLHVAVHAEKLMFAGVDLKDQPVDCIRVGQ